MSDARLWLEGAAGGTFRAILGWARDAAEDQVRWWWLKARLWCLTKILRYEDERAADIVFGPDPEEVGHGSRMP